MSRLSTWGVRCMCALLWLAGTAHGENYAVLFAGGNGKSDNEPRYYEQIERQYRCLRDKLNYKPENIWIVFADGLSEESDQSDGTNSDWSVPDGEGAHVLPGNREDLFGVMDSFQQLDPHDMFYFFCYDHGSGTLDDKGDHDEEKITAWSGSDITDDEFAAKCDLLGTQRQTFILGQCYSGGILEELDMSGDYKFGCASCTHFEKSYSYGYDGLNECWTDAVNEQGQYMTSDLYVTAREDMGTYYDPDWWPIWGGEGPGSPIPYQMAGVTHPWKRGSNFDVSIARWRGNGTSGGGTQDYADTDNWSKYHGGTQTLILEFTEAGRAVLTQHTNPQFLSVDSSMSLGGLVEFEVADGGYLQVLEALAIGDTGYGKLLQTGGVCHPSYMVIGAKAGSYGVYHMTGGMFTTALSGEIAIGKRGYGLVLQEAGTVTIDPSCGYLRLGQEATGLGEYRISGNPGVSLSVQGLRLGEKGSGTLRQEGGSVVLDENLLLGQDDGSQGQYDMSGGYLSCDTIGIRSGEVTHTAGIVTASSGVGVGSGDYPAQTGRYELGGSGLLNAYSLTAGTTRTGDFIQSGGTCTVTETLTVGQATGSQGTYELSGGGVSAARLRVAYEGIGQFVQSGGTAAFPNSVTVGYEAGSLGVLQLSGGDLNTHDLYIGRWGTGRLTQTGGTVTVGGDIFVGLENGSDGTLQMQGGTLNAPDGTLRVGQDGTGTLALDDGTLTVDVLHVGATGSLTADDTPGTLSLNTLTLPAGVDLTVGSLRVGHPGGSGLGWVEVQAGRRLDVKGSLKVGSRAIGVFSQHDSSHVDVEGDLYLGCQSAATGTYSLTSAVGAILSADNEYVGYLEDGYINHGAGTNTVDQYLYLGFFNGVQGTYDLSGTGTLHADTVHVGVFGTGSFNHTGGLASISDTVHVGVVNQGTYSLSGGQLVAPTLSVGGPGIGLFEWTGGDLTVDTVNLRPGGTMNVMSDWHVADGLNVTGGHLEMGEHALTLSAYHEGATLTLSSGSASVGYLEAGSASSKTGTINQTGGTLTVANELRLGTVASSTGVYDLSADGQLSVYSLQVGGAGTGTFTHDGDGHVNVADEVILGFSSSGNGTYTINDGTLDAGDGTIYVGYSGTGALNINGGLVIADYVQVGAGGTLSASGNGTLRINGLIEPPDTFFFGGNIEFGHGGGQMLGGHSVDSGQSVTVGGNLTVGRDADALFDQNANETTVNVNGDLVAGAEDGVIGTYSLAGQAAQFSAGSIVLGVLGEGQLNQSAGTCTLTTSLVMGQFRLGSLKIGTGSYTMDGGTLSAPRQYVGWMGDATFTQNDGINTVGVELSIAESELATGPCQYNLNGGTLLAGDVHVGREGTGEFNQEGGTASVTGALDLGTETTGHGTYGLWEGDLTAASLTVGDLGTGSVSQGGGNATVSGVLCISNQPGSTGLYDLEYGTLNAGTLRVGNGAGTNGQVSWMGGTLVANTVEINEGGTMNVSEDWTYTGQLNIAGGMLDMASGAGRLTLDAPASGATLVLSGGQVFCAYQHIGPSNKAVATQTGGTNMVDQILTLGGEETGSQGVYSLQGGTLDAGSIDIGGGGSGRLDILGGQLQAPAINVLGNGTVNVERNLQHNGYVGIHGGTVDAAGYAIYLGVGGGMHGAGGTGSVEISDGTLHATGLSLGYAGTGIVSQTGGTVSGEAMWIGRPGVVGQGQYDYAGGTLDFDTITVLTAGTLGLNAPWTSRGMLNVVAGSVIAEGALTVEGPAGQAHLLMEGGSLLAGDLQIGITQPGRFEIADASAGVTVSNRLRIGPQGEWLAVPGATVRMTGSKFRNESTDPAKLAGLANTQLAFVGGWAVQDDLEVASQDMGAAMTGCASNFALGTLRVGSIDPEIGWVRLVDDVDNQPEWSGTEAMYVHRLCVGSGSQLDLNGKTLYYLSAAISPYAGIELAGGSLIPIAIPGAGYELLGIPPGYTVDVNMAQAGTEDRGTFGMIADDPTCPAAALSCTFEIDPDDLGMALSAPGAPDYLTLKMYYDENELALLNLDEPTLRPYWWDGYQWVLGGTTTLGEWGEGLFAGPESDPAAFGLGYCGLNMTANYMWVNLNHASAYGGGGNMTIPGDVILGDVNGDGVVDGLDIQPFVDLLTGGGYLGQADINADGVVDGLDIQPFVDLITGGPPVPEPGCLLLLAAGAVAAARRRPPRRRRGPGRTIARSQAA